MTGITSVGRRVVAGLVVAGAVFGAGSFAWGAGPVLPLPPVNTSPPSIAGSAASGATVTCSQGQWLNSPTSYRYSWQRNLLTTISGPSVSDQYKLSGADVGQVITCTVTATNSSGSMSATSLPITPVASPVGTVPIDQSPPAISGPAEQGQTVTCSPGAWLNNPTSYSYNWQRDGLSISGQTASQYTLTGNDVNQAVTCTVVAVNASGDSAPAISLPILPSTGTSGGGSGSGGGAGGTAGGPGGGAAGSVAGATSPRLTSFTISPRRMLITANRTRERTKGEILRYTLDRAATVVIVLEQRFAGQIAGKRCVAITRRSAHARRCTGYLVIRTITVKTAQAGNGQLHYTGRAGKHLLRNGSYRALLAAVNTAGWSKTRSATFTVIRK